MNPYYPIFIKVNGKRCVVVGGGEVARRKVSALLEHRAKVEVVSPGLCPELGKLAESGQIGVIGRNYLPGDLKGALIAIAATDDHDVNLKVANEARETGVLVNVVDDPDHSDFIVPSIVQRGDLTIAISTAGKSPALARKIRTRLEKDFGEEYAALTAMIDEGRTEMKRRGVRVNSEGWQEALDLDRLLDLLRQGDKARARDMLLKNLEMSQRTADAT